jgi:hypothetical protein
VASVIREYDLISGKKLTKLQKAKVVSFREFNEEEFGDGSSPTPLSEPCAYWWGKLTKRKKEQVLQETSRSGETILLYFRRQIVTSRVFRDKYAYGKSDSIDLYVRGLISRAGVVPKVSGVGPGSEAADVFEQLTMAQKAKEKIRRTYFGEKRDIQDSLAEREVRKQNSRAPVIRQLDEPGSRKLKL